MRCLCCVAFGSTEPGLPGDGSKRNWECKSAASLQVVHEVALWMALMQPRSPVATVDLCIRGATIHGGGIYQEKATHNSCVLPS